MICGLIDWKCLLFANFTKRVDEKKEQRVFNDPDKSGFSASKVKDREPSMVENNKQMADSIFQSIL